MITMLKYEGIPPYRYFELIVHESIIRMNKLERRADIFMNKMLGFQEYSSEADILCVGRKGDDSIGIIIECKKFEYPGDGDVITYYDKPVSRASLTDDFKKKRDQAYLNCGLNRVIVLTIFNDKNLNFERVQSWLYILGCKVEFPKKLFPYPQKTPSINHAWDCLSEGMTALNSGHTIIKNIKELPCHEWYQSNRDYSLIDEAKSIFQNTNSSEILTNFWGEDQELHYPKD